MSALAVYAQKLLNSDLANLICSSTKDKNERYSGAEDGWRLQVSDREHKFRQVWIQGFVLEYFVAKDLMLVDDGSGTPFSVINASKNPTTTKWLLTPEGSFDETKRFYVQVLGEPVLLKSSKTRTIHVAAIKVQNLADQRLPFTAAELEPWRRAEIEDATKGVSFFASDDERLQLFAWILEVADAKEAVGVAESRR